MNKYNLIIYHDNCNDGFGSATVAYKHLLDKYGKVYADSVKFHGAYYGSELPDVDGKDILILDFSYDADHMKYIQENSKSLFVIDHHKSANERFKYLDSKNYLLSMNNAGVVLTWKYFNLGKPIPKFLRYIEDRDMWWNKMKNFKEIFLAITTLEKRLDLWLNQINEFKENKLLEIGNILLKKENDDLETLSKSIYIRKFNFRDKIYNVGYVNSKLYRSDLGNKIMLLVKNLDFAGIYYYEGKNNKTIFSLRSLGFDVSKIAEHFGGGGHNCAAGVSIAGFCNVLPDIRIQNFENSNLTDLIYF